MAELKIVYYIPSKLNSLKLLYIQKTKISWLIKLSLSQMNLQNKYIQNFNSNANLLNF